jgi:hypothetical protein
MDFLRGGEFPECVLFCLYGAEALSVFERTLTRLA